jgi:hypothetical protein
MGDNLKIARMSVRAVEAELNKRDAEIELLRIEVANRAHFEQDLQQKIERLRRLLREYLENDLTDEWEYSFLQRVREALGYE